MLTLGSEFGDGANAGKIDVFLSDETETPSGNEECCDRVSLSIVLLKDLPAP